MHKKYFSLTFDMDDINVLCEGYGIHQKDSQVVYARAIPRIMLFLSDENIKATFFVIADKLSDRNVKMAVRELSQEGHEIANHSYHHDHYLKKTLAETDEDIRKSTQVIEDTIGKKICGFRGPSLTFNKYTPELLEKYGYLYDSSIHPTPLFIGEWLYLSFFFPGDRNNPDLFFLRHAVNRLRPYPVSRHCLFKKDIMGSIVEFPISTVPFLRVPYYPTFHFMTKVTEKMFRKVYFSGSNLVFLCHALDFLNIDQDHLSRRFKVHPGLDLGIDKKIDYFGRVVNAAKVNHQICTLETQRKLFP